MRTTGTACPALQIQPPPANKAEWFAFIPLPVALHRDRTVTLPHRGVPDRENLDPQRATTLARELFMNAPHIIRPHNFPPRHHFKLRRYSSGATTASAITTHSNRLRKTRMTIESYYNLPPSFDNVNLISTRSHFLSEFESSPLQGSLMRAPALRHFNQSWTNRWLQL